nr:alpha/beta fold hydrolase [Halospina denitrificans]
MRTALLLLLLGLYSAPLVASECVILLHGLVRTSDSMADLEYALKDDGYFVSNIDYPSRDMRVQPLAEEAVPKGLRECREAGANPVNFVTHSLGGILVRQYYSQNSPENVNRVVMLGPPNQGSAVVDNLKNMPGFDLLNGPAGRQLGTGDNSVPDDLGPVNFETGIIAGTESINLILSTFLEEPNDGKVSVEAAKVEGMCSFVTLPAMHPFMMQNENVIQEVRNFLKTGSFGSEHAQNLDCAFR